METQRSRARGSLLGLAIGDALGATLEFAFEGRTPVEAVGIAKTMPGGGCHGVAPGQVTDDTELALALSSALAGRAPRDGFPAAEALDAYRTWFKSAPFDVGITCKAAFGLVDGRGPPNGPSMTSQSNGSLMRIAPLAVWASGDGDETVAQLAIIDASLSHQSKVVHFTTAAYAIAIAALVRGESALGSASRAIRWLEATPAASAVLEWASSPTTDADFSSAVGGQQGWVKHAFRLAFHHLREGTSFEDAMTHVLGVGGDTDTNAAICGALLGARDGVDALPTQWVDAVRSSNTRLGHERPLAYHPIMFDSFIDSLC